MKSRVKQTGTIINLQQDLIGMFQENVKLQKIIYDLEQNKDKPILLDTKAIDTWTTDCSVVERDLQIQQIELQQTQVSILPQLVVEEDQSSQAKGFSPLDVQEDQQEIFRLKIQMKEQSDFIKELIELQQTQVRILPQLVVEENQLSQAKGFSPLDVQEDQQEIVRLKIQLKEQSDFIKELIDLRDKLIRDQEKMKAQCKEKQLLSDQLQILWNDEKFGNNVLHARIQKLEEDSINQNRRLDEPYINRISRMEVEFLAQQKKYDASQSMYEDQVDINQKLQSSMNQYHKDVEDYEFQYAQKSEMIQKLQSEKQQIQELYGNSSQNLLKRIDQVEELNQRLLICEKDTIAKDKSISGLLKNQNTQQMLIKEYCEDLQVQQDSIEFLTNKLHHAENKVDIHDGDKQIQQNEHLNFNEIKRDYEKKEDRMIDQMQSLMDQIDSQEQLFVTLKRQHQTQINSLNEQIQQMGQSNNKINDHQEQDLNQQIGELQEELSNQLMKYQLLQQELNTSMEVLSTHSKHKVYSSKLIQTDGDIISSKTNQNNQFQSQANQLPKLMVNFCQQTNLQYEINKPTQNSAEKVNVQKYLKNSDSQTDTVDPSPSKKALFEISKLKEENKCLQKQYQDALENYYYFQAENKKLNDVISQTNKDHILNIKNDPDISEIRPIIKTQRSQPLNQIIQIQIKSTPSAQRIQSQDQISSKVQDVKSGGQLADQKLQEFQQTLETCQDEMIKLKQKIISLQSQNDEQNIKLQEQSKLIEELQNSQQTKLLEDCKLELDLQKIKVVELQEKLKKLSSELSQKSLDYSMMKNLNNFLHRDLEKLNASQEKKQ